MTIDEKEDLLVGSMFSRKHCCITGLYALESLALEESKYTYLATTPPCTMARVTGTQTSSECGRWSRENDRKASPNTKLIMLR